MLFYNTPYVPEKIKKREEKMKQGEIFVLCQSIQQQTILSVRCLFHKVIPYGFHMESTWSPHGFHPENSAG